MDAKGRARLAGAAAGLANGLVGGGGGMSREKALRPRQLFATCVAVIFPVCAVSAAVCLLRTDFDFLFALPYLVGGFLGGLLGGRLYGKVSPKLLRYLFAAFLLYAAVRYLT